MSGWLFASLRGYQRGWIRNDVLAGLTVWAVLVPESLAYATIAGVSPVVGLYAAVPSLLLYAALGSSRHLVVGPMSATAALSAGVVGALVATGTEQYVAITVALAIVTGLLGVVAGLLRLGILASLISEPVLKGFIVGLALTIIVGQVPKMFGVEKGEGNFFAQAWAFVTDLGDTHGGTLVIGLLSLGVVMGLKRWRPMLPGSLIAVLLGIAVVSLFNLDDHGVAIVGQIQAGLPSLGLPDVTGADYLQLAGPAVGVLLVGFAEGLGAAKTYAARAGYDIDPNRELLGMGGANLGSGLASGMVVNGSLSKTAVNGGAGAKSQISGLVVAVLTVVTLLFLTGLFEQLPEATLAAVVVAAVIELVDVPSLRRLYAVWTGPLGRIYGPFAARADFVAALAAMLGVLVFDTLPGLIIGIVVSMVLLLYRAARPNVATLVDMGDANVGGVWVDSTRHPNRPVDPTTLVVRVESGLFFANADHVRSRIRALCTPTTRAVVLDGETMAFVDVTAADMLSLLAHDLERDGIQLSIARDVGQVRDVLRHADESAIPAYRSVDEAVTAAAATRRQDDERSDRPEH